MDKKSDKRKITSAENGRKGGRPVKGLPLSVFVAVKVTEDQAAHVKERGGAQFVRSLIERDRLGG